VNTKIVMELLNDTNYERWAREMMILIAGKGLTLIVDGTETYPASPSTTATSTTTTSMSSTGSSSTPRVHETLTKEQLKWKSRDVMAKALIASYMEPHFRRKYWGAETSRKMWTAVRKDQKQTGAEHFHRINNDLRSLLVTDFPTVVNFNEKFKSLLSDLTLCDTEGHGMSEMEATYILLRALPTDDESWRTFRQIHSNAGKPQALMDEMVKQESRMKSERRIAEARSSGQVMYSRAGSGTTGMGRKNEPKREGREKNITCFNCGKKGHMKKDCWSRAGSGRETGGERQQAGNRYRSQRGGYARGGRRGNSNGDGALWSLGTQGGGNVNSTTTASDPQWWIDSGCSNHVTGMIDAFTEYKAYKPGERTVNVADSRNLICNGIGSVKIIVGLPGGRSLPVTIENIFHVPKCRNLLSMGQLMEKGLDLRIEPKEG